MRKKREIEDKLFSIKEYINTVSKEALLKDSERIAYTGSMGAVKVLEWVLGGEQTW